VGARPWECQIHFDLAETRRDRGTRGDKTATRCHVEHTARRADRLPMRPIQRQLAAWRD
jgi:hypothetical protein